MKEPKENKRMTLIAVRLTPTEVATLKDMCNDQKTTKSKLIRCRIFHQVA